VKKFRVFWVTLVCLLALGLAFTSCGDLGGESNGGDGIAKTIIITGFVGKAGSLIDIYGSTSDGTTVFAGHEKVSGSSAVIPLVDIFHKPWTGTGSYCLEINMSGYRYYYTNGKSLVELGIDVSGPDSDYDKLPKYNISSANSTIDFSLFYDKYEWQRPSNATESTYLEEPGNKTK
jgi:hypothetical protein